MTPYRAVKATTRAQAVALARRMCRCNRMSFAGVQWQQAGQTQRLTWAEIDAPPVLSAKHTSAITA